MKLLHKAAIVLINQKTVKRHGGNFVPPHNLLNEERLDYLIEAVDGEIFGEPMYPAIEDKAAFYMHSIISGHVFQDGNKRTGLAAALLLLEVNGRKLKKKLAKIKADAGIFIPGEGESSQKILENFTLEVASGKVALEDCKKWFLANTEALKP
ncbi:MAG: type II toxin-antitoxin system death-on-curing family toxin [Bacteroidetes bacterium]|nr:type II toxin-antitoxin system death-on-curing family toxin [Bacteroidota bacterium]